MREEERDQGIWGQIRVMGGYRDSADRGDTKGRPICTCKADPLTINTHPACNLC